MPIRTSCRRAALAALLCHIAPAAAQIAPEPDADVDAGSGAIIVTATRAPLRLDQLGASVTVLDRAAIDASQSVAVSDLLARTPGVTFTRNGGVGTNTALRIRGAEAEQTVVVIDGVKLNDPSASSGQFNFAHLLVGDADRIEVLRGPQSIPWGSQAIGGVVNIVTAEPEAPLEGSFDVEAGSRQTAHARAGLGGLSGPVAWRIAGSRYTTDGISASTRRVAGIAHDRDGYTNSGASARMRVEVADGINADLRGVYSNGRNDFDSTNGDTYEYSTTKEAIGYAGLQADLFGGRLRNRIAYAYTETDRDNFNPQLRVQRTFDAAGRNRRWEYQGTLAIAEGWTALFGAERERSSMRTASPTNMIPNPVPVRGHVEINSLYGQLHVQPFAGLTVTGGLRYDDHDSFGHATQAGASLAWSLNHGATILRASYGEGFKAPTIVQLYGEAGNAALRPEEAKGWDAGIEQRLLDGALLLSATYYERDTTEQIAFISCRGSTDPRCAGRSGASDGYFDNLRSAAARGVELAGAARLGERLTLDANYTWTDTENRSPGANLGKDLDRRPRHTAYAAATFLWPAKLSTTVAVRYAGRSFDNLANSFVLDDYTLVDLRALLPVGGGIEAFARIENLFEEYYETARNYGTLGRSAYAGLRARF